jgi:hypothetical protein
LKLAIPALRLAIDVHVRAIFYREVVVEWPWDGRWWLVVIVEWSWDVVVASATATKLVLQLHEDDEMTKMTAVTAVVMMMVVMTTTSTTMIGFVTKVVVHKTMVTTKCTA